MSKQVGKRIKEARLKAELTQDQLAKLAGNKLTGDDISKAERGMKPLTEAQVRAVARATGVTGASLLGTAKASPKTTGTKKSTTKTTSASGEKKPKTPASAGLSMRVTAAEKRLVELYRAADGDTKKRAASLLKGESGAEGGGITDFLSDALSSLIKGK